MLVKEICNAALSTVLLLCLLHSILSLCHPTNPHDTYELVYFGSRGKAEPIRMLLHSQDVSFTDTRVLPEEWRGEGKLKEVGTKKGWFTYSQLPCLHITGSQDRWICQSNAILKYVARVHGLEPASITLKSKLDVLEGGVEDLRTQFSRLVYQSSKEEFDNKNRTFVEDILPQWMSYIENVVSNGLEDELLLPSYVSFPLWELLDVLTKLAPHLQQFVYAPSCWNFYEKFPGTSNELLKYLQSENRPKQITGSIAVWGNGQH